MKILMFGRGVIAATYGWALAKAGHEVEFYVRPGRAAGYGDTIDLDVLDARRRPWGRRVTERLPVRYRETLEPDHDFDLIVLSVQHYHFAEAAAFVGPRAGRATILVFNNLWTEPREAVAALPADRIAWGFPGAGGGFDEHGTLRAALLPIVFLGTITDETAGKAGTPGKPALTDREQAVRDLFRHAGFRISEQPDFRGWLLIHFIQNAGLHTQSIGPAGLTGLTGSPRRAREAVLAIRELLPLVAARGVDLRRHRGDTLLYRAPARLTGPLLAALFQHFPPVRRVMTAHANPAELRAVCRDTLAEARRRNVPTPRLAAAERYL